MCSRLLILAAAVSLATAATAGAQFAPPQLELGLANPGARSLGIAGAFVALADDATAAFSNPAGLVQIQRLEVSLELRGEVDLGGPSGGAISRTGASLVGFASFVYPRKRFSLALYYHQLVDLGVSTTSVAPLTAESFWLQNGSAALAMSVGGLAAAYQVRENLSVGLGVSSYALDLSGRFEEIAVTGTTGVGIRLAVLEGTASDLALTAGVLWDFAPAFRLGGFYRQGPRFEVGFQGFFGPAAGIPLPAEPVRRRRTPIAFADTFGAGIAWRTLRDRLTLSFEWSHIDSSRTLSRLDRGLFDTASFTLDDGDDLHLGGEWIFLRSKPVIALRAGLWREDSRPLRRLGRAAPGFSATDHRSVGIGLAWKRFQIDLAADWWAAAGLGSLSFVYSF